MSNKLFTKVQLKKPETNTFDLTHDVKMSGRMGNLMPVLAMEMIPGDQVTLGADSLIRFAPLIAPVMHRMDATIHYFFVPNRLVWDGWEDFITNQSGAVVPWLTMGAALTDAQELFLDYLGVPPFSTSGGATTQQINAIPAAAYQCIWNEYYRDQNLITETNYQLVAGSNDANVAVLCKMQQRAWEHDYLTSCLPTAQQSTAVDIPLGEITLDTDLTGHTPHFRESGGALPTGAVLAGQGASLDEIRVIGQEVAYDPDGTLVVDATTITDLRRAFKLQEWLELSMRGGKRYIENILAFFGVRSSDKRLQRPEYITGVKTPVIISEVLNTTGEAAGLPQGNMAGHAVSVGHGNNGSYYCEEHGWIIGIMSVTPKTAYQQGIPRQFLKSDVFDYFWPQFQHIGEQEVYKKEVYAYGANGNNTFGYIPRYAEYKFMPSRVAGDFRTTLDYWHLGRIFASEQSLNQTFIEMASADTDRIFAVTAGDDNLYIHILHKIRARRLMAVYGNPML